MEGEAKSNQIKSKASQTSTAARFLNRGIRGERDRTALACHTSNIVAIPSLCSSFAGILFAGEGLGFLSLRGLASEVAAQRPPGAAQGRCAKERAPERGLFFFLVFVDSGVFVNQLQALCFVSLICVVSWRCFHISIGCERATYN